MARQPVLFSRVLKPVQLWWQRVALSLGILLSISMMIMDRAEIDAIKKLRIVVTQNIIPVVTMLSQPIQSLSNFQNDINELMDIHSQVARLQMENNALRETQNMIEVLSVQNSALRKLNNFIPIPATKALTGRVIATSGGAFAKSILINIGKEQGSRPGQAVLSDVGLVGTIVEVGAGFSRVLLINDLNSQVPVVIQNTGDPAIMMGDNSNLPLLKFLPRNSLVEVGDMIVTSGHGGVLPPDLPVGNVAKVGQSDIRIVPLVDWERLDYIRLLNYSLSKTYLVPKDTPAQ